MRFILAITLLISINGFAQWKSYIIGVNGDTLNCVDLKGKKQGRWVTKVEGVRGEAGYEEEGLYINSRKEGPWRKYSSQGDLTAMENYRWGNKDGQNMYYNNMGNLLREESWKAVNPDNPYDTVDVFDMKDPTRVVERRVVKLEGFSLKHGLWKMYDPFSGTVASKQKYWLDKPVSATSNGGNDDLAPIDISDPDKAKSDTIATKKILAKPQAIVDYEKKNSGKKKIKVRDGRTGY